METKIIQENKSKCQGILGKIFGHKYKVVYDIDEIPISHKELVPIYEEINNQLLLPSQTSNQMDKIPKNRVTKIPDFIYCIRCGNKIENKPIVI